MIKAKLAVSGLYSLAQNVTGLAFGLGTFMMLARITSKYEFGTWAQFMTVTSLLEVARNGLVQNAQIKFMHDYADREPEILKASLVLTTGFTVFFSAIMFLFAGQLADLLNNVALVELFKIYSLTGLVLIPFSQLNIVQQARMNFGPVFATVATRTGLLFLFVLWYFVGGHKLEVKSMAWVQLVAAAIASLMAIWAVKGRYQLAGGLQLQWIREQVRFGKYVFGTNVSAILYGSVDQLLLGRMLSPAVVGVYNNAVRINTLAEVPVATAASILYPYKVQLNSQQDIQGAHKVFYQGIGAVFGLLLPVVMACWLFAEEIITLMSSEKYIEAAPLLRILACSALIQPFLRQFGTQMDSSGRPEINFSVAFGMAILNTLLNYFFITHWGITGAAVATLLTQVTFLITAYLLLNHYFQLRLERALVYTFMGYQLTIDKISSFLNKRR